MTTKSNAAQVMPATAALVAELRAAWGSERVDAALAAGQQARREFKRLEAAYGRADADAWLARQKFPNGRLYACEGGREVGVMRP